MNAHYVPMTVLAIDLDGTLIPYSHENYHHLYFPDPVPAMAERVVRWIEEGHEVVIFTSRLAFKNIDRARFELELAVWSKRHFGKELTATCIKEPSFKEIWDDRAVAVEQDTGRRLSNNSKLERDTDVAA